MAKESHSTSDLIDLFKSKSKFEIYNHLKMFGQLSLTELAEKLGKSKSTIHEHLKPLLQYDLVQVSKIPVEPTEEGQKP